MVTDSGKANLFTYVLNKYLLRTYCVQSSKISSNGKYIHYVKQDIGYIRKT